jgi:hypothetical protein
MVAARRTGGRVGDAVTHPASIAALCWLIASSLIGRRRGTLAWRGRPLLPDTGNSSWVRSHEERGGPAAPALETPTKDQ